MNTFIEIEWPEQKILSSVQ